MSHKVTLRSPDGMTENQIDHVAISRKWRSSLHDIRVKRRADVGSDVHLVAAEIKIKLLAVKKVSSTRNRYNTTKLRDWAVKDAFVLTLFNRYEALRYEDAIDQETALNNIKIKRSVKILGVRFTYHIQAKQKLNIDELISAIQLVRRWRDLTIIGRIQRVWRWRDLTIIGRIQIVKTFIIPIFLYPTSLISLDKEYVKEANKIIFDFIWKGKDKVKRSALISDMEDGGRKAPHLNSIIETQRVICCKKLAKLMINQAAGKQSLCII